MNSETGSKVSGSQVNPGRPACSIGAIVPAADGLSCHLAGSRADSYW